MFIWVFGLVALVAVIALNVIAAGTVSDSIIHTQEKKRIYTTIIWGIPVLGVIYTMVAIRRDIKENQKKVQDDIVDALKGITDNLENIEANIKRKNDKTLH